MLCRLLYIPYVYIGFLTSHLIHLEAIVQWTLQSSFIAMSQKPFSRRVHRSQMFFHSSKRCGDGGSAWAMASIVSDDVKSVQRSQDLAV